MSIFNLKNKLGKVQKETEIADQPKVKLTCGLCHGTGQRPHGPCAFCECRGWYWGKA